MSRLPLRGSAPLLPSWEKGLGDEGLQRGHALYVTASHHDENRYIRYTWIEIVREQRYYNQTIRSPILEILVSQRWSAGGALFPHSLGGSK